MKKSLLAAFSIMCFMSCGQSSTNKNIDVYQKDTTAKQVIKVDRELYFVHQIDSLKIHDLYNNTKWALYCLTCDDTVKFKPQSGINIDTITFASLDMKMDTVILNKDTTELDFSYVFNGKRCDYSLIENVPFWGIRYIQKANNKLKICYSNEEGNVKYFCPANDRRARFLNFQHPDVIKYINENADKLNPWFRAEAERRGLLKPHN